MPYELFKKGNQWCVRNKESGENKGCSDTKEEAISHMRLLGGVEHGWKPTGKKRK